MLSHSDFFELQQRLVSAWHKGDVAKALAEVEVVLREGTTEMKGQCLFYRGMIREDENSLKVAMDDWVEALQYAQEGTFLRYELEHKMGEACERSGLAEEAAGWYRRALNSCLIGADFAGNRTLAAFLRVAEQGSQEDRALFSSVIQKSWAILELPGQPDLTDFTASISLLESRFNEMVGDATASG
jgi:tetratricopeptide (TPR) repeat protein